MNILITGGAGFVGSNLAINLKKRYPNYRVISFDNLRRRGSELNLSRLREANVEFIHGDIRNFEDLASLENLDVIIDASADPSVLSGINSPVYPLINSNLIGTVNCLEAADKFKAAFIFLSTSRVYPIKALESCDYEELESRFVWKDKQKLEGVSSKGINELFNLSGNRSFYGTTKLASELLIGEYHENKNMRTVINRCGVISGPWQMGKIDQGVLVLWLARHYFKGSLNYIGYGGQGKQMRDVLHIDDLFDLIDIQIHNLDLFDGETFNVGGGLENSFSLVELTQLCEQITGNNILIKSVKENRAADIRIYVTDNRKISKLSNWNPKKNVETLVQDTFSWIRSNENSLREILS